MKIHLKRLVLRHPKAALFSCLSSSLLLLLLLKRGFFPTYDAVPVDPRRRLTSSRLPCAFPVLRLDDPRLSPLFRPAPPLACTPLPDLVCVQGSAVGLCPLAGRSHLRPLVCDYEFIRRLDDDRNGLLVARRVTGTTRIPLEADFFNVRCQDSSGSEVFSSTMAGISRPSSPPLGPSLPPDADRLNFLMFGFDSLSRLTFMRKLPRTFSLLQDQLGGVVLRGHNIVGDGTPQAFLPMLTGRAEPELPEARRRRFFTSGRLDSFPFVWRRFRSAGYVTAYAEDAPSIGTFSYRLTGFDRPPTDHYMRPFYVEVDKVKDGHPAYCLAGTPRHKVHLDWIERFFDAYPDKPKFMVSFHCELSHDDINLVGLTDDDVVQLLTSLQRKGHLNSTLVMLMSDHGNRFAEIRQTKSGKYEERLPFFSLLVPDVFKNKHPEAWANLQANADRLTTPFDIHSTIGHVLNYSEEIPGLKNRSISLFRKVPELRSCEDADIEPHWCTCLNWGQVDPDDQLVRRAAEALVTFINNATSKYRSVCAFLGQKRIEWAERFSPSLGILKFKQAADPDGFKGDFSAPYQLEEEFYQIKVVSSPGDGQFEATLRYDLKDRTFQVALKDISRVNAYGRSADCMVDRNVDLLKFCYCKTT